MVDKRKQSKKSKKVIYKKKKIKKKAPIKSNLKKAIPTSLFLESNNQNLIKNLRTAGFEASPILEREYKANLRARQAASLAGTPDINIRLQQEGSLIRSNILEGLVRPPMGVNRPGRGRRVGVPSAPPAASASSGVRNEDVMMETGDEEENPFDQFNDVMMDAGGGEEEKSQDPNDQFEENPFDQFDDVAAGGAAGGGGEPEDEWDVAVDEMELDEDPDEGELEDELGPRVGDRRARETDEFDDEPYRNRLRYTFEDDDDEDYEDDFEDDVEFAGEQPFDVEQRAEQAFERGEGIDLVNEPERRGVVRGREDDFDDREAQRMRQEPERRGVVRQREDPVFDDFEPGAQRMRRAPANERRQAMRERRRAAWDAERDAVIGADQDDNAAVRGPEDDVEPYDEEAQAPPADRDPNVNVHDMLAARNEEMVDAFYGPDI